MNVEDNNMISIGQRRLLDFTCCFGFFIYAASVVIIPVCLLDMAKELNFSLAGGGSMEFIRSVLLFVTLLISGHAAAYFGKPKLLSWGSWVTAFGLLLFSFADTFWAATGFIMLIGLGTGMLEALINPLVQDIHPNNAGKALNIVNAFFSIGVLVSSLLVGEALTAGLGWRILFQILAVATAIVAILFQIARKDNLPKSNASFEHIADILNRPRFWWFGIAMICAGAAEASFTFWSASFVRLNYVDIPRAGAIATAVFAGSMFVGRVFSGYLAEKITMRKIILYSAYAGFIISLFVPFANSMFVFCILLVFSGLFTACFWPSIQAFAAEELPVDSTLLFIFLSCFGIPGFGLAGWIIGIIGDKYGLSVGFLTVPVFFAILAIAIFIEQKCAVRDADGKIIQ